MAFPKISVVVPSYNRADYLPECLDSIILQEVPDIEIIVVDDGSTDNTNNVLSKYLGRIVVVTQRNSGIALARTAGILAAKSNIVAFVDSDDKMLPGRLGKQFEFLQAHPDVAAVSGNIVVEGMESENYLTRAGVEFSGNEFVIYSNAFQKLLQNNFMANSAVMFRRDRFFEIGGYDIASLPSNSEDWDLWLRMSKVYKLACLNWPSTWVRKHQGNVSNSPGEVEANLAVVEKALRDSGPIRADILVQVASRQYKYLKSFIANSLESPSRTDWVQKTFVYAKRLPWYQRLFLYMAVTFAPVTSFYFRCRSIKVHS